MHYSAFFNISEYGIGSGTSGSSPIGTEPSFKGTILVTFFVNLALIASTILTSICSENPFFLDASAAFASKTEYGTGGGLEGND